MEDRTGEWAQKSGMGLGLRTRVDAIYSGKGPRSLGWIGQGSGLRKREWGVDLEHAWIPSFTLRNKAFLPYIQRRVPSWK